MTRFMVVEKCECFIGRSLDGRKCIECGSPLLTGDNWFASWEPKHYYKCMRCGQDRQNERRRDGADANRNRRNKVAYCEHPECVRIDRQSVLERGDFTCGICLDPIVGEWHMDHIIPVSKNGKHCYDNIQPSHPVCNLLKGDTILVE
jgi:5-methylcytosine-specific restriction endonuclease McrA